MRNETAKFVRRAVEELTTQIESGSTHTFQAFLKAMARFHRYSATNILLIHAQMPEATQVAGYGSWRRMGRYVRRGEKSIRIVAPIMVDQSDQTATLEEPSIGDHEPDQVAAFKHAYLFDISQTEGMFLPSTRRTGARLCVCLAKLRSFVKNSGVKITSGEQRWPFREGATGRSILMNCESSDAEEWVELVRQFARVQLNRLKDIPKQRTVLETEVSSVALVVCNALELDAKLVTGSRVRFGGKRKMTASVRRIHQVSNHILSGINGDKNLWPCSATVASARFLKRNLTPDVESSVSGLCVPGRYGQSSRCSLQSHPMRQAESIDRGSSL